MLSKCHSLSSGKKPTHHKYEELFLRYYKTLQSHLEVNEAYKSSAECVYKRAIYYLECGCSAKYGFRGELHHSEKPRETCINIGSPFESALLLPFLIEENTGSEMMDALVKAVDIRKRPETGFWGYFPSVDENHTALFPDDIESTSIAMLALYTAGKKTKQECQDNAKKMVECALKDENGALGTWLPNLDKAPSGEPRNYLYKKLFSEVKMDANSLVNTLCYMTIVGLEEVDEYEEKLQPTINASEHFVADFVNQLAADQGKTKVLSGMYYYPNKFPVYLFLCRYLFHSERARKLFGSKMSLLVKKEILEIQLEWAKAMDLSCLILAALYLKLHQEDQTQQKDSDDTGLGCIGVNEKLKNIFETLLKLQQEDGEFETGVLFRMTSFGHYAGSKHISTALAVSAIGRYCRQVVDKLGNTNEI